MQQAMSHIQRRLVLASRSAVGEQHLLFGKSLGLDKKLVEGRMLAIRVVGRHGKFYITGKVEVAWAGRTIDQGNSPYLNIFFGRNHHLGFRMDAGIRTAEDSAIKGKIDGILFNIPADRVIGIGPDALIADFMNVAEDSIAIAGCIRSPAGKFLSPPLAVTASAVGDHYPVTTVAEQQSPWCGCMRGGNGDCSRRDQIFALLRRQTLPC